MKIVQAYQPAGPRGGALHRAPPRTVFSVAKKRILLRAIMTAIVIALMFAAITMIIWKGATDVAEGRMTGGTIAAFVLYGGLLAGAFGALSEVYGDLLRAAGASERLGAIAQRRTRHQGPRQPRGHARALARRARIRRTSGFRYPTRLEVSALHDFSLKVRHNERLALVGPSGAGKTTIFQLAERFYDPQEGRVLLDGVDLRDADPADVRKRIAMVPQEVVIFAASARDNLRYGNWDASRRRDLGRRARRQCRDLPAPASRRARHLHGRRRRAPVGRAAPAASPSPAPCCAAMRPLLLLDEATSALDAESEAAVQDALERLMEGRTTIVIAHRLATVRAADRIIVMDGGRIVEEGKPWRAGVGRGLYARLARLQFQGEAA